MNALEKCLLNDYQRNFPLVAAPYRMLAGQVNASEDAVRAALAGLIDSGAISRIGAVFRPGAIGASTLAAMAVSESRLDAVARQVSAFAGVNHNYSREHRLNLWFVAAAADRTELDVLLARIASDTGIEVIDLPLLDEYHIDLGFDLHGDDALRQPSASSRPAPAAIDPATRRLTTVLQQGLTLDSHPYAVLGERAGMREEETIATLARLIDATIIKRFGVIVRHRKIGYTANAMVVFDVPDNAVAGVAQNIASLPYVTLCYRRARHPPEWPYNLFCMIHGKARTDVEQQIARLRAHAGILDRPHAVLFSRECYTQRGPRYAGEPAPAAARALHG